MGATHCYGSGDYAELKRLIKFVVETYGEELGYNYQSVDESKLNELGLEIYVEGEKVKYFVVEYGTCCMRTDTYYTIVVAESFIECDA